MNQEQCIAAFCELGEEFGSIASQLAEQKTITSESEFSVISRKAWSKNGWFTPGNIQMAFRSWSELLRRDHLEKWLTPYADRLSHQRNFKKVGVVNAGNVPLVGFHDFLSVLISGHDYIGKNAADDPFLLPFVADLLIRIEPGFKDRIRFVERLSGFDAVLATGSNNSARYFEYYFSKVPHIIRKNMNGIAVLNGRESRKDLELLGADIFTYFGLGCRNVSKLYVPSGYDFKDFFESVYSCHEVQNHHKYMNNFDYHSTVLLLKGIPFLQNGFLIIKEDESIPSPVAVVHYEYYTDETKLIKSLSEKMDTIQCIVTRADFIALEKKFTGMAVGFGDAQHPALWDYADRVDTMNFLSGL